MPGKGGVLTDKKEKFCQNLFLGMTKGKAYRDAFDAEHQTKGTSSTLGCVLAKDPLVAERVQQLRDELKERNMITVEAVLRELGKIAFDDIKNHLSFMTEKTVVDYDGEKQVFEYRTIVNVRDSDDTDTRSIAEVSIAKGGAFKFRLYDKEQALINIGKYLGMFSDKVELTGKEGGPIVVEDAREKLAARITKLSEYRPDRGSDTRAI